MRKKRHEQREGKTRKTKKKEERMKKKKHEKKKKHDHCLHDMESLATKSPCQSNVSLVLSIVVSIALDCCLLLLSATASQLDQLRQDPVLPSQTFR